MRMSPRSWQWREEKPSPWCCPPPPSPPSHHPGVHTWTPVIGEFIAKQGTDLSQPRAEDRAPCTACISGTHQDAWMCWILPPKHLPLPAVQCPPSASTGFILSFHIPTHPCFLLAQIPSFCWSGCVYFLSWLNHSIIARLSSSLQTLSRFLPFWSLAAPSQRCLLPAHIQLCASSPLIPPAWVSPLTDPSPTTHLYSPQTCLFAPPSPPPPLPSAGFQAQAASGFLSRSH